MISSKFDLIIDEVVDTIFKLNGDDERKIVIHYNKNDNDLKKYVYFEVLDNQKDYPETLITDLKTFLSYLIKERYPASKDDWMLFSIIYVLKLKKVTPYKISKDLGISKENVYQWINGKRIVPVSQFSKIMDILNYDPNYIVENVFANLDLVF